MSATMCRVPSFILMHLVLGLGFLTLACNAIQSTNSTLQDQLVPLSALLSKNATIVFGGQDERWSDYAAPQPGAIVKPGSEGDIATTVAFAAQHNISFLLQGGGHGWADTFTLGAGGIVIDVSSLKGIAFSADSTSVTFQAGVVAGDLVSAAWTRGARVLTGTCNCVGLLGATLGGGLGRLIGLYGMGVDQLLAVNYVDATGRSTKITPDANPDLWWAVTGAGPNFGIVTSAVYKSYPVAQANNTAWYGALVYDPSQLEAVIAVIDDLPLEPEMHVDFTFTGGELIVLPFYLGSEAQGRLKFAPLLALGPAVDSTSIVPYDEWNAGGDAFCIDGGRKPTYTANLATLEPVAWRETWDALEAFVAANPEANASTVLTECYSTVAVVEDREARTRSSYPWGGNKCYAMLIPWYTDAELDDAANEFGQNVRSYWDASSGYDQLSV